MLGFLLGVMALPFQWSVNSTGIVGAGRLKSSTIQDLGALMRKSLFSSKVHGHIRVLLLSILTLPLGLSGGYKTFTGSHATKTVSLGPIGFGFTAAPGKQRVGTGLSICIDEYLPFWINPPRESRLWVLSSHSR